MTKSDKKHWIVVLIYGAMLCISLVVFLKNPRGQIAFFAQAFGPTIGTIVLAGFTLVQMFGKRISPACGFCVIVFLIAVSVMCLVLAYPLFQS